MNYLGDSNRIGRLTNQQLIKEDNIKRVFDLINASERMSRAELVRLTQLSPTTVSALVDELIGAGLVVETGTAPTGLSGRRPIRLAVNAPSKQIAVFSLSRWGVMYTLYNLQYEELENFFLPHASDQYGGFEEDALDDDPEAGEAYARLFEQILASNAPQFRRESTAAICVSFPGIYLRERDAFSLSSMRASLSRQSMEAFEARVGINVFFANCAMCSAYAEKKWLDKNGAAVEDLMYVIVCDGVGAGMIVAGEMFTGFGSTAGEIGHITIDRNGLKCNCGARGCLERYVSIDAVLERATRALEEAGETVTGLTLEEIARRCAAGEKAIVNVTDAVAGELFAGIHAAVCITGIKSIVLGGGIEKLGDAFLAKLTSFTEGKSYRPIMRDMHIRYTCSGETCASVGAAQYYVDRVFSITR